MGAHILVVDDDETVCRLAAEILADAGHDVALALSVDEALASARERSFDIVLSDLVLGTRDGLDLAEALGAIQPSVRVVFMSGYGVMRVAAGQDDPVLAKPFRAADLLARIDAALAG